MFSTAAFLPLADVLPIRGLFAASRRGPSSVPKHVARPRGKASVFFLEGLARSIRYVCCARVPILLPPSGCTSALGDLRGRGFRYAECMRFWRVLLVLLLLGGVACGVAGYVYRRPLRRQWALYRIGAAASPQEAEAEIVGCLSGARPRCHDWRAGRQMGHGQSGSSTCTWPHTSAPDRAASRCARHSPRNSAAAQGCWTVGPTTGPGGPNCRPTQQMASVVAYLDALIVADPPRDITLARSARPCRPCSN